MAIDFVDFPMKNGDFPLLCESSPEGTLQFMSHRHNQVIIPQTKPCLKMHGHVQPCICHGQLVDLLGQLLRLVGSVETSTVVGRFKREWPSKSWLVVWNMNVIFP